VALKQASKVVYGFQLFEYQWNTIVPTQDTRKDKIQVKKSNGKES